MTKGTGLVPACVRMMLNLALSTGLSEVKILPEGAGEEEVEACLGEGGDAGGEGGEGEEGEGDGGEEEEGDGEGLVPDEDDALDTIVFDGFVPAPALNANPTPPQKKPWALNHGLTDLNPKLGVCILSTAPAVETPNPKH